MDSIVLLMAGYKIKLRSGGIQFLQIRDGSTSKSLQVVLTSETVLFKKGNRHLLLGIVSGWRETFSNRKDRLRLESN